MLNWVCGFRYDYDVGNFDIHSAIRTRISLKLAKVVDNPTFDEDDDDDEQAPFRVRFSSIPSSVSVRTVPYIVLYILIEGIVKPLNCKFD